MAILERTPPQRQRHAYDEGTTTSAAAGAAVTRSPLDETFKFPSLDAMAAPIRERNGNAWQQQSAASVSSSSVSPAVRGSKHKASPQRSLQRAPTTATTTTTTTDSPKRGALTSPHLERKKLTPNGDSSTRQSPAKAHPSATTAVDEAFEAQMERAIALGENPFMDRRRAAMRDDSNVSSSSMLQAVSSPPRSLLSRPHPRPSAPTRHESLEPSTKQPPSTSTLYPVLPRVSTSTSILVSPPRSASALQKEQNASRTTSPSHHSKIPTRTTEDVQRATAVIRRSLLNGERKDTKENNYTSEVAALQSPPPPPRESPPRQRSPPIEVFTPQRKKLSSEPQIIPFAQQEELHNMRVELHACKAQLRQAQLDAERHEREAQTLKKEHARMVQSWTKALEREQNQRVSAETELKAVQYAEAHQTWKQRMVTNEDARQARIDAVIAQNEITYLNARRIDAEQLLEQQNGKQDDKSDKLRQKLAALQDEVAQSRAERKQAMLRVKQHEVTQVEMQEQVDKLQADVARETARRKEVAHREATLLGKVEELQDVASREAALRKDIVELKAALRAEKEKVAEMRAMKAAVVPKATAKSSSPQRVKSVSSNIASSSARKMSRLQMQAEEDMSTEQQLEYESPPPSPPPARKPTAKSTHSTGRTQEKALQLGDDDDGAQGTSAKLPPKKTRPAPRPVAKHSAAPPPLKQRQPADASERAGSVIGPAQKKAATATAKASTKKKVMEVESTSLVSDNDELDYVDNSATAASVTEEPNVRSIKRVAAQDKLDEQHDAATAVPTFVPVNKKAATSLLSKARDATKKAANGTAPRRREASGDVGGGDEEGDARANNRARKAAAVQKVIPSYDETMKTPLLPTRRTRLLNADADDGDNDNNMDVSVSAAALQKAKKDKPSTSEIGDGAATPFVAVEPKKKRRKLLKAGANVAGDFITWKGDADGGLNPQLNLPMELSPLKPGEGVGGGGSGGGGGMRFGGNAVMAGANLFGGGRK